MSVAILIALGIGLLLSRGRAEAAGALHLTVSMDPGVLSAGDTATLHLSLRNGAEQAWSGAEVRLILPAGFAAVPGEAEVRANHTLISRVAPISEGGALVWSDLTVPEARAAGVWGMHTFVQDRCQDGAYVSYQLDRVLDLMGEGAYVKQLFHGIDVDTAVPHSCWVDFVDAVYDRGLLPIVRLQGSNSGLYWYPPPPGPAGDYRDIARAYARVVAGLPRRAGQPLYVEIWNEPNLDIEWGGRADPAAYGRFLVAVAAEIRALGDTRVKVLNGGLSPGGDVPPIAFIDGLASVPGALEAFDLWAAHPYPGNRPPEQNLHDGTAPHHQDVAVDSYLLELDRLAAHGRTGLEVILTETGYALGQDNLLAYLGLPVIDDTNRADYVARAFSDHWGRWAEVVGVTPFQLVDPYGFWAAWDWLRPDGSAYLQYEALQALSKALPPAEGSLGLTLPVTANAAPGSYMVQVEAQVPGLPTVYASVAVQVAPGPSPTPTPGPRPTLPPWPGTLDCREALANGGFEEEGPWELNPPGVTVYSTEEVYAGQRSLRVGPPAGSAVDGNRRYHSAWQAFTVPGDARRVTVSFRYYPLSEDPANGRQYAMIYRDGDPRVYMETILMVSSDAREWQEEHYELGDYRGEPLWLVFGTNHTSEAEGVTLMYVDEASVRICVPQPKLSWLPLLFRAATAQEWLRSYLPLVRGGGAVAGATLAEAADGVQPAPLAVPEPEPPLRGLLSAATMAGGPEALALDSERGRAYVAGGGSVQAVDLSTARVLWQQAVEGTVGVLAVDRWAGAVYASRPDAGEVVGWLAAGREALRITGLGRPTGLAIGQGVLYVADPVGRRVLALSLGDGQVVAERLLDDEPHPLVYDHDPGRLYVGLMESGRVLALDGEGLGTLAEVALGGLGYPSQLALDPDGQTLYVAHAWTPRYGALSAIQVPGLTLVAQRTGDLAEPLSGSVALAPVAGGVVARLDGRLLALSGDRLETMAEMALPDLAGPGALAYDTRERLLYATSGAGLTARDLGALEEVLR